MPTRSEDRTGKPVMCPTPDRLLGFASGELSDDESATIESHIDSCGDCRSVLSNHARGDVPPTFGRYRLDTVLGSGGMGIVYRAWDPQLARAIAIKVVRRAADDETGRARLVREAQSLARLSHPNVCHVYDVGTEGDEVWVAMELVDGVTLREWAADRHDDLLGALLGAAEGIGAAHAAGLVHRDIKPENVLITRDGRAIVTDFGLARGDDVIDPKAPTLSTDPHLTATGAIVGTPAYLAPEQLTGEAIDARVDQFAWAVMAWELLTGSRPFPVVFAIRLDAIRAGLTPPPTLAAPLAAALTRAMAIAPKDRFPSMRALIEAVRETPRRNTRAPMIAGLAVLVTSAVAIGAWEFHDRATPSPSPSPSPSPILAPAPNLTSTPTPTPTPTPPPAATIAPPSTPKPRPHAPSIAATTQPPPTNTMPAAAIINSLDPPLRRASAIGTMDQFCHIPYDAAHPDPATRQPIVDWGTVASVEREVGTLRGDARPLDVVTATGQRGSIRFETTIGGLGRLDTRSGDMLAWCSEREPTDIYQLPKGPITPMTAVVRIAAPPRIVELAALQPLHISETSLGATDRKGVLKLATDRRYLVRARVAAADGTRWKMDGWWLEVPARVRGEALVAAGKWLWIVVEQPVLEDQPEGKPHLVLRAAAVLDDLFPQ